MGLSWLRYHKAEEVVKNISRRRVNQYLNYWNSIAPLNPREYYERWLFAYMAIRTGWKENVRLFQLVRALQPGFTKWGLHRILVANRAGMVQTRSQGIWQFQRDFWSNPTAWYPQRGESMQECRDRIVPMIHGLGLAKVSFVLEMAFPSRCDAVCVDTHIYKLYGLKRDSDMSERAFRKIEQHWSGLCLDRKIPPPIGRHIYWDHVQNQPSTRYWSHVFEMPAIMSA